MKIDDGSPTIKVNRLRPKPATAERPREIKVEIRKADAREGHEAGDDDRGLPPLPGLLKAPKAPPQAACEGARKVVLDGGDADETPDVYKGRPGRYAFNKAAKRDEKLKTQRPYAGRSREQRFRLRMLNHAKQWHATGHALTVWYRCEQARVEWRSMGARKLAKALTEIRAPRPEDARKLPADAIWSPTQAARIKIRMADGLRRVESAQVRSLQRQKALLGELAGFLETGKGDFRYIVDEMMDEVLARGANREEIQADFAGSLWDAKWRRKGTFAATKSLANLHRIKRRPKKPKL